MRYLSFILLFFISCTEYDEYQLIDYNEKPVDFVREWVYSTNNGAWFPLQKTVELVNTQGEEKIIKTAVYDWSLIFEEWTPVLLSENQFENENLTGSSSSLNLDKIWTLINFDEVAANTTTRFQFNNESEEWEESQRTEIIKNEEGEVKEELTSVFNREQKSWENESKIQVEFDENGNRKETLTQKWENGMWNNYERTIIERNENENDTQVLIFDWDKDLAEWIIVAQNESVYNDENKRTVWTLTERDPDSGVWRNSIRILYRYSNEGLVEQLTYQSWVPQLGNWYTVGRYDISITYERD